MKKLLLILALMLTVHANNIDTFAHQMGYETVYKKALAKANAEHKGLMLVMVTHYCPWCQKFEQKSLKNKEVNTFVQKHFVALILNRELHAFPDKFDTPRIPTTYFIDASTQKIIATNIGYRSKKSFLKFLTDVVKK